MFYNFPGAPGNTGYQAQANPNPLTDPRFKIPGGAPWGNRPLLPNEKETFDKPFTPLLNPGQNVPMAQGFAGDIGNMAGMAGMSGMEGAQLAGGFNLLNPMTWGQAQEAVETSKKGIKQGSNKTPVNTILNRRAAEVEALRQQSLY
jgi:hypothetical protein